MAPRTRTRQRKDRRKWTRTQQLLKQQKEHQGGDFPLGSTLSPGTTKETESHRAPVASKLGAEKVENKTILSSTGTCDTNGTLGQISERNTGNIEEQHPPDCRCMLRGMNFFLPPAHLASTTTTPDDYYCLEISSNNGKNRKK